MRYYLDNLKKIIVLGIISLILSGCATLGRPLDSIYKQSIQNIAVVSVMGDTFEGTKVGTTIFNKDQFEEDFSAFEMDRKIEESLVKYLKHHSGFNALIRSDLREEFHGAFGYKSKPKQSLERLEASLQNLKAEGIDAVFIISPDETIFQDTTEYIHGYGFGARIFLMICDVEAHFISKFILIDTSMQKIVFDRELWLRKDIKFSKWQKSFLELEPTEQEAIRNFLSNVIDSGIPKFLEKSNF